MDLFGDESRDRAVREIRRARRFAQILCLVLIGIVIGVLSDVFNPFHLRANFQDIGVVVGLICLDLILYVFLGLILKYFL